MIECIKTKSRIKPLVVVESRFGAIEKTQLQAVTDLGH
jgi:hypothetical protein